MHRKVAENFVNYHGPQGITLGQAPRSVIDPATGKQSRQIVLNPLATILKRSATKTSVLIPNIYKNVGHDIRLSKPNQLLEIIDKMNKAAHAAIKETGADMVKHKIVHPDPNTIEIIFWQSQARKR